MICIVFTAYLLGIVLAWPIAKAYYVNPGGAEIDYGVVAILSVGWPYVLVVLLAVGMLRVINKITDPIYKLVSKL